MRNQLGFMSGTGVLASVVVLLGVVGWTAMSGPVLFSPGPLNAQVKSAQLGGASSHAQLVKDCGACHPAPWSGVTMADRCLGCHTDIASQIQAKSDLHGRLLAGLATPTCRGCHTDHHGPSGALTVSDPATFPHDLTAYSLHGHQRKPGGARFACTDCHAKGLDAFDQTVCANCHSAIDSAFMSRHEAAFGNVCLICHTGRLSNGSDFDHSKLAFKLNGKHAGVACGKCHNNIASFTTGQAPRDCGACHAAQDKHKGAFGTQCGGCHDVNGWTGAKFDHKIFPTSHGNHGQASPCQTCHPSGTTTYTCYGCHEHTAAGIQGGEGHRNQTPAQLADCIRCHKGGRGD